MNSFFAYFASFAGFFGLKFALSNWLFTNKHFKLAGQSVMPLLEQEFLIPLGSYPSVTWIPCCMDLEEEPIYLEINTVISLTCYKTVTRMQLRWSFLLQTAICCSFLCSLPLDALISEGIEGWLTLIHKPNSRSDISDTRGGDSRLFYNPEELCVGLFAVFRSPKPLYRIFSEGKSQWNYMSDFKLFCMAQIAWTWLSVKSFRIFVSSV